MKLGIVLKTIKNYMGKKEKKITNLPQVKIILEYFLITIILKIMIKAMIIIIIETLQIEK